MNRLRSDDGGAALVLVLLIVTVVAVMLGALLSLAGTSETTTVKLRAQATDAYGADGAMQTAINTIRNSTYNGATGNCFGSGNTMTVPYGSGSAAVSCAPDPAKVTIQCVSLTRCNRPGQAMLTLGNISGENGLNIQQPNGTSTFQVHGAIVSNSNINVSGGSLNTNTAVYARTGCSGSIQSTPAANCDYSGSLDADPNYSPLTTTVPAYQPVPKTQCTQPGSVITFQPGYYDDAAGLSGMMSSSSACKNSTWWFKPGVYYFDFHNSAMSGSNPVITAGGDVWTVDNGTLVAGTPVDSTGKVVSQPAVAASVPGACDNPINDPNAQGVQFIFGNDSQFAVKAGQAEICGTRTNSSLPIALYGLKSGSATTSTNTVTTTAVTPGQFSDATVGNLSTLDGTYANWTTTNNKSQVGQVTLGGYPTSIPAGSQLISAQLKVGHKYATTSKKPSEALSVTLTPNIGSAPAAVTIPSYTGTGAEQTDTVDLTAALAQTVHDNGMASASLSYQATVGQAGTESLDAVQLVLSYIAPAFRAESGCVTTGPYTSTGSSSCAAVSTPNNSGGLLYVQGTTYVPNGVVDIILNNVTQQIFRFGVISRSLWVKETGAYTSSVPVIEVPDDAPGFVFSVFLSVYVCPTSSTCAAGGPPALQSRVAFIDASPAVPVSGQRQVAVLSWSGNR